MTKTLKWIGGAILASMLFFLFLAILVYLPPVQNWAVKRVASYASEKMGMEVSVSHVNLEFPLDLGVEGIKVVRRNDSIPQIKDTVADIAKLVVDVQVLPLFSKQVMVDELDFRKMKVNTTNFIHEARIKGELSRLSLKAHGIDWGKEKVRVDDALVANGWLSVELSDTVKQDTTPSTNFWKIDIAHLKLRNTDFTLHLPGDTLKVNTLFTEADARRVFLDLHKGLYQVGQIDWLGGHAAYDNNFATATKGLDFNHLLLDSLDLQANSFSYCDSRLAIRIHKGHFCEKSGIKVKTLTGTLLLDSIRLRLPDLQVQTTESVVKADVNMELNTFADTVPGRLRAILHGSIGKQDLMRFLSDMPTDFRRRWPNYPLRIDGSMKGNLRHLSFAGLQVSLPTAFRFKADGWAGNLTSVDKMRAKVKFDAKTFDLAFLTSLLDPALMKQINIPRGIGAEGSFSVDGQCYAARFIAREGGGQVAGSARMDVPHMAYQAKLQVHALPLQHFLPRQGLHPFTGYVEAEGVGTDLFSPKTRLTAHAKIEQFNFGGYNLDHIDATARVARGRINALIDSRNALLKGRLSVQALTHVKHLQATVSADLDKIDLFHLRISETPIVASLCGHIDVGSDMKDYYQVRGLVSDITVWTDSMAYRPEDVVVDVLTRHDTTHAVVDCGDFHLNMDARGGYRHLQSQLTRLSNDFQIQLKARHIDQIALRHRFPLVRIYLDTGRDNFICHILERYGCFYKSVRADLTSSPQKGLDGYLSADSLVYSGVQLDTVRALFSSNDSVLNYNLQVINNKNNPQYTFKAIVSGTLGRSGSDLRTRIFDINNRLGLDVGMAATMEANGVRLSLTDTSPILGYKRFEANSDNYFFLADNRRVSAKLQLQASDGAGVDVFTNDDNTDALQDVTLSLHRFNLDKILSVIPYTPDVSGIMDGDFHAIQTAKELSVSSNISINNLVYEHSPVGNVSSEFVYMPKADGSHYVDGRLLYEDEEVGTLQGTYRSDGDGYLDAKIGLERLPLHFVNGFIPNQLMGLRGYGEGELDVKGSLKQPQVNGEVYLDSAHLFSIPYGVEMRFANDPVRIVGSHLLFENFEMFANNSSPLNIAGDFDFSNLDRMVLDVRMRAENFQLIAAKENYRSEAYGKAFVNFFGMMRGPLDNLQMRGRLDVLGTTDMTYVLRESELTTDNQLDELVKFINFKDKKIQPISRPKPQGLDMAMSVGIDESAHILCALNADHSNYIDLMGGGELRMSYNPSDNLQLTGRYTLNNGKMKYSLPVIPLKTFSIQDGSRIEFTGDPYDPQLNITATEEVKASVNSGTGSGRSVDFECGVKLSKTLTHPGIQFIISAPNDMSIQDELNTMSVEERGKVAITMLASGMYLVDGNTSSFSMNSALSSFLNSEINNIAGSAIRSMGFDLGMTVDNSTNAAGGLHTDYNFKFAKRLWNNRLSVIVGGQVSTGAELDQSNHNNSFFDNVELEYRLDQNSSKYLRAFYDNSTYDWLEGRIGEYGIGFMWRRKLLHFRDIFRFGKEKSQLPPIQVSKDTVKSGAMTVPEKQKNR